MTLYCILIVVKIILDITKMLYVTLNFISIVDAYSTGSTRFNVSNNSNINEKIKYQGYLENDFNRVNQYDENRFKTSDFNQMNTQGTFDRQKRFTHYSDTRHNLDIMDISKRCLCPWKTKWHYDSRRTPVFLAKAICGHKCNFNFTDTKLAYLSGVLTSCEPFTRDVRVFIDNKEIYLKNWPVACLCTNKIKSVISKPSKKRDKAKGKLRRRRCSNTKKIKSRREKRKRRQKRPKRRRKKNSCRKKKKKKKQISPLFNSFRHRVF